MSDRRFTIQTEPRAVNTMKTGTTMTSARDDIQGPHSSAGPPSIIPAAAATAAVGERRPSQSVFRRLSVSMGGHRKSSMLFSSNQPRPNTYRLEPEHEYRFRPYKLQAKVLEALMDQLKDQTYDSTTVNELLKDISRSVHQLVKNFQLPRYKIVIQTTIVQKSEQVLRVGSRCLWDPKTDNMVTVSYETKDMVVVVTIFGVYYE